MEVPILKHGSYLISTIQTALTDNDLIELQSALVTKVSKHRASAVIIDVTSMDVVDSFSCRTLHDIAHIIRLSGAETLIVGIQPEVAFSMVQLGLTLEGIVTALDLEEGLAYLDNKRSGLQRETTSRGR